MLNILINKAQKTTIAEADFLNTDAADKVKLFHQSLPGYSVTPLQVFSSLAQEMGVGNIFVKDESFRFGLNSFKGLGGSFAIAKYITSLFDLEEISFSQLCSKEAREKLGQLVFITATDGNHGRGVAWAAKVLGHKAVVYMPAGSSPERLEHIKKLGAEAYITTYNYDDTVRFAEKTAKENGWILMQDTALAGYEKVPTWIMQGYLTMVDETVKQLQALLVCPTHVILQAGVGSMAATVAGYLKALYGEKCPDIIVVESEKADCLYQTVISKEEKVQTVTGEMNTIMAGLACGEPNLIALPILKAYTNAFITCPDNLAALGMRLLAATRGEDKAIISGESGAIGAGVLGELMWNPSYEEKRHQLKLDQDSKVLIFSTEGDTDAAHYKKIVWGGLYSNY